MHTTSIEPGTLFNVGFFTFGLPAGTVLCLTY